MFFYYPPQYLQLKETSEQIQQNSQPSQQWYPVNQCFQGKPPRLPPTEPRAYRLYQSVNSEYHALPQKYHLESTQTGSSTPKTASTPSTESGCTSPTSLNFAIRQGIRFLEGNTKSQTEQYKALQNPRATRISHNKLEAQGKTHSGRRNEKKMADPGKVIRSRRFYPPTLERDPINMFQVPASLHPAMNIWVSVIPDFQGKERIHGPSMAMTSNRLGALWRVHCVFINDDKGFPPKARDVHKEMQVAMETLKIALAPEYDDYKGDYLVEVLEGMICAIEATLQN